MRPVHRLTARLLLTPVLFLMSGMAPAHAHHGDDDHAVGVVHRHVEPHAAVHDAHHEGTDVEQHDNDDDADVVWLNDATLGRASYQLPFLIVVPAPSIAAEFAASRWILKPCNDSAPPHGPPRASLTFRGPPSLLS